MTEIIFKKKYRFTFAPKFPTGSMNETFVKLTCTPKFQKDEPESEVDYLSAKTWIPGELWNTFSTFYYGLPDEEVKALGTIIKPFLYPEQPIENPLEPDRLGTADLVMYDPCGRVMETWVLDGLYPQEVNFIDLDHSMENLDIEIRWKYSSYRYITGSK